MTLTKQEIKEYLFNKDSVYLDVISAKVEKGELKLKGLDSEWEQVTINIDAEYFLDYLLSKI